MRAAPGGAPPPAPPPPREPPARPDARRRHGLVGALTAVLALEDAAGDGLTGTGKSRHEGDEVDVDRTDDEDLAGSPLILHGFRVAPLAARARSRTPGGSPSPAD